MPPTDMLEDATVDFVPNEASPPPPDIDESASIAATPMAVIVPEADIEADPRAFFTLDDPTEPPPERIDDPDRSIGTTPSGVMAPA
jgi:hypothetical protein